MKKNKTLIGILTIFAFIVCIASVQGALTDGLISYYNFSNTGSDVLGRNDLTVTGATYGTGKVGNGGLFVNSGDKMVKTSGSFPFNITTTGLTICGWFNSTDGATAYQRVALIGISGSNNKIGFQLRTDPSAWANGLQYWNNQNPPEAITGSNYTRGSNYFIFQCGISNSSGNYLYQGNGVLINSTSPNGKSFGANGIELGQDSSATTEQFKGMIDEFGVWNRSLTVAEIQSLYNSGAGLSYPFNVVAPSTNGISFVSQSPANLTAFDLFTQNLNVTYNYTNQSLSMTGLGLNYTFTGAQSCLIFVNGSCMYSNNTVTSVPFNSSSRTGNSTVQSYLLSENMIYPSTAVSNYSLINQQHSNYSMTGNNDFIAWKLLNVSNITRSNILEVDLRSTAVSRIYACNSSINLSGVVDPILNANCQEIGSINSNSLNHTHGNFSGHNLVSFSILNGSIGGTGIKVTSTMWFLARGNNAGVVNVGYVPNGSLSSSVYSTANGGNSWTDRSATFSIDTHLLQYAGSEYVNYYAYAVFNGTMNVTSTVQELIDVPPLTPSPPMITNPFNTVQSTRFLNITYLNATANTIGVSISKYNLTLLNADQSLNRSITTNNGLNNSYYYDLYAQNLSLGQYYVEVCAFDSLNYSSCDQEWFNLTRNAVLNVTAYDQVTSVSISNLNINVTDLTTHTSKLWNTSGSLLNIDIIKGRSYSMFFDVPSYAYTSINFTSNSSFVQKLNQSLYKTNSLSINIYDESSLSLITNVTTGGPTNVTFISNTSSFVYNTSTGSLFVSNITADFYEVKFNAPLYSQRSYYVTVTNRSTQTLNAYLSQSSITLLLTYVNKETGELTEGCGVVVAKIVNGSWTTVASGFTDITGRVQFSVSTNTNYRFSSTCTGYEDKNFNLNPVIFTSYTIQLTKIQSSGSQLDFSNINVYVSNTTFSNNGTNTFLWQISAPSGNLESYGYSLSTPCKNISSFSGVNSYGDMDMISFNLSCATTSQVVTLNYNYTLSGGEVRTFSYTYGITGPSTEPTFTKNRDEHYGMGLFERALIAVIITIVMAGLITKFSNIVAGLVAGLFIMGYLSSIGFIEWWLIAPTLLVGFILISSWSKTGV